VVQLTETCRSLSKNFETLNGRKKSALVAKAQSHSRRNKDVTQLPLTVKELQHAATLAIKATQATTFKDEIKLPSRAKEVKDLQGRSTPRNATSLQKLNLFLDQDGIVRVGVQIW